MTSKERMLLALHREKPDRLPVSIHQWQGYHLDTYLGGMSDLEACIHLGFDAQIQYFEDMAQFWLVDADYSKLNTNQWQDDATAISTDPDNRITHHTITTPGGILSYKTAGDRKTTWITEYLVKHDEDIDLVAKYMPVPALHLDPVAKRYDQIGDHGILRGFVWGDQAGCWQHAACLMDISDLILATYDKPDWVHRFLSILLEKKLQFIDSMKGAKFDLIETGGGASSSTLISPPIHKEFCLPYDRKMHDALHDLDFMVTYHTCGGTLGIEEYIVANGCDASETLAPISVGGNQEPWDVQRKIGDRVALIGGIDQFNTLEGSDEDIRSMVHTLFETVGQDGGYICSCSDHFFDTPVDKLRVLTSAARECIY
ncbi:MAG: uroporphyrinogen decarboxylase family protein [Sphaerochaeta sp.]|nr:uroporphyrinogen decarboxylase family protein [Sphaerochaeta sp.]